jgi:predicted DsbA family dithiol-disulfide isomerase
VTRTVAVDRGVIVVYSDIACPWAHLAVHRLHETRARLGLQERVIFEHRAFPLELVNRRPTPKRVLDGEIPVAAALGPHAGWRTWRRPEYEYPVTTVPALAAVQAAAAQGAHAAEELDRALRIAMFVESRCISVRSVILDVAERCPAVDHERLAQELDGGGAHATVITQWREGQEIGVRGSPHLFFPDGSDVFNPGVTTATLDVEHEYFVHVERDDPSVYDTLVTAAALPG